MISPSQLPAIGLLLCLCVVAGSLPITAGLARLIAHLDLRTVGTGNVSVAAAFKHGGPQLGIPVVLGEIGRGILPLLLTIGLAVPRYWGLLGLIPVVVARFVSFRAGGATNWGWGLLVYDPMVFGLAFLTGLGIWPLVQSRRWGARWGWLSAGGWAWILGRSPSDGLAMLTVALVLVLLDRHLQDDMSSPSQSRGKPLPLQSATDPAQVGSKAATLSQLLAWGYRVPGGWGIPVELAPQVDRWVPDIPLDPACPLIVRSSALDEDGASHSLAGVYESIGGITTAAALKQAALDCLQSYHSPTAVAYRAQWQLPDSGMALLVQPQISGQVLGVAFSRQPVDGSPRIIIEASDMGDPSVVSGAGIPVHLEIPVDADPHLPDQDIVPVAVLEELVTLTQELEARFHGIPQDIEWIWDGYHLTLLQCRPITSLQPIWTRTIAAEVIPGAIRPLTWSINRPLTCGVWGDLFTLVLGESVQDLDFTQTATLLGSHAYFNATLLGAIFRQMGLPEQGLEFLLRGGKMGKPPRSAYGRLLSCLPGLWRLIQMEGSLPRQFEQDDQEHFQPTLDVLEQVPPEQLTQAELWGVIRQIQDLLKQVTLYNILAPIGFAIRRSIFRTSDTWLQDITSPDSQALQAMHNLAQAAQLQANQSGIPVVEALRLAPLQEQFQRILKTYGYLSEVGTDIAVPCWLEQPQVIEQMVVRFAASPERQPGEPDVLNVWQRWRRSQCQPRLDLKGKVATVYARLLAHLRWSILTLEQRWLAGGILTQAGDIFFLEQDQIEALALAKTPIPSSILDPIRVSITDRKRQFEQDQIRSIPPVVYGSRLPESPNPSLAVSSDLLIGIPGSAGKVIGTIQVLKSLTEASSQPFQANTILVVPYTDAGWSPLLATASGIISEVGGQLSHGAILAREYGIPAVMNVAGAMTLLTNGQQVRLDGGLGQVEILTPPVQEPQ